MPLSIEEMRHLFSQRLAQIMTEHNMNQVELSKILGVSESTVGKWLLEKSMPRMGIIQKLSDYFKVGKSYFLEESPTQKECNSINSEFSAKDEREINEKIESILSDLDSTTGLAAYGGTIDSEDDIELIKSSLEQALRLAKRAAKSKFTPNKYKQ